MHLSVDQAIIETEIAEFKCEDMFYYPKDMLSSYGGLSNRQWVLGLEVL